MALPDLGAEEAALYELFAALRREATDLSVDLVTGVRLGIAREEAVHERLQRPDPVEVISDHLSRIFETFSRLLTSADEDDEGGEGGEDDEDTDDAHVQSDKTRQGVDGDPARGATRDEARGGGAQGDDAEDEDEAP